MADPELRSDETVLVRTPGVYVKAIPFEGILTNKRIILIDRAKNLLPPTEIPLVTIKEFESAENAIRDQIIMLSVITKTGETRQMILTFSRQVGGNRIKERDEWMRVLKENVSFSPDQVIRNVIPGPEPAPGRAEPAAGPRYEIVRSPIRPAVPSVETRPAGTVTDDMSAVMRTEVTIPVTAVPPSPAVRQSDLSPLGTSIFCSKCGNKVPAESVFCNRCGSPIVRTLPVSVPVQPPVAPTVTQVPATPPAPVVKTPASRPIDEEIKSIEPLMERSTDKIPPDALRTEPVRNPFEPLLSWDDNDEEPAPAPAEKSAEKDFIPPIVPVESVPGTPPASTPSYESPRDISLPPKPPGGRSFIPGKKTLLTAAVALFAILLVATGVFFVLPMLTSSGTTTPVGGTTTPVTTTTTRPFVNGTIIPFVPTTRPIPATGVFIHVNYLGGFEGSYGMPDILTTVPGNSGDRVWEVENANGTVQAEFMKQDGSARELLVEIYKDGKSLTSGTTTIGHGSVALSVNTTTGIAAAPVTSGGGSMAKTTTAIASTTTTAVIATAPAANMTTVKTTTVTTTNTAASITTAAP